ncbi:MAG: SOS response-associated peptidase [Bacilli bacterium]
MCGRFSLNKTKDEVEKYLYDYFGIEESLANFIPRYNIAPTQLVYAVIHDGQNYRIGLIKWGLKNDSSSNAQNNFMVINARSETLLQKPMFQKLLLQKRCLILADGFYEWDKQDKTPYYISLHNKTLFTIAGLWNTSLVIDGSKLSTCTIITTKANSLVTPIHDRMPVIFDEKNQNKWLSYQEIDNQKLLSLLQPYSEKQMEKYSVSTLVNNPKNDTKDILNAITK